MRNKILSIVALHSLLLASCGSEDPAFVTQSLGKYYLSVDDEDPSAVEQTYSMEAFSDEEETAAGSDSFDVLLGSIDNGNAEDEGKYDGQTSDEAAQTSDAVVASSDGKSAGTGKGTSAGSGPKASAPSGGTADGPAQGGSDDAATSAEQQKVAKACAPHFRGQAQKIKVIDAYSSNKAITVTADTVIAIHLRGNQDMMDINLGASQGIAGLCVILTGNQSNFTFSSASSIQKLVYAGRGNMSQGSLTMTDGASINTASIQLQGNQPKLTIKGVDSSLCAAARLKGNSSSLSCGL